MLDDIYDFITKFPTRLDEVEEVSLKGTYTVYSYHVYVTQPYVLCAIAHHRESHLEAEGCRHWSSYGSRGPRLGIQVITASHFPSSYTYVDIDDSGGIWYYCTHMKNLRYHFPTCYAYSVKEPIGELNLKRVYSI